MADGDEREEARITDGDEGRARDVPRVGAVRVFYGHVLVYIAVMAVLLIADLTDIGAAGTVLGLNWAYWPLFIWGAIVVIDGIRVFAFVPRREERTFEKYLEDEQKRHPQSFW